MRSARTATAALVSALAGLLCAVAPRPCGASESGASDGFTPPELRQILRHGPWPPESFPDPSNRVWANPYAIALGERLFFDRRLSRDGTLACVGCHLPGKGWTDGLPRAQGRERLDRNTPGLWNVAAHRWFGWDGATDSLWAASVRPIVSSLELAADPKHVGSVVRGDRELACLYERAFGAGAAAPGSVADLVNVAKSLAAFMGTLVSGRSAFDDFRDALATGDLPAAARYPAAARRGLKLFHGKGNCSLCHLGPTFANGEFADVGVPYMVDPGRVDPGRFQGIRTLTADPLNLLGPYNDDRSGGAATKTRHVDLQHRNWGEFKVPSLRNVALTAPYMHDGRLATLRDVVRHYSELNEERLHADGERLLRRLDLTAAEVDDLVAFLESLTDTNAGYTPRPPPEVANCAG